MIILGIETSCDETGAAVVEGFNKNSPVKLISNSLATSLATHAITGGVIPENAAREQIKFIIPVIIKALKEANLDIYKPKIDAIAVTFGPGLIGSLLVGIETAKTLSLLWNVPLIPVNHLFGHIYANWIYQVNDNHAKKNDNSIIHSKSLKRIEFPAIALVVSGGHTDLVLLNNHGEMRVIGGTRDDAAGEAFDKIGRLIGLPYPAGPLISAMAVEGNAREFNLPRPMRDSKDYDFSFSGLKTSVLNLIKKNNWNFSNMEKKQKQKLTANLCASVQEAIIDVLVYKTVNALKEYKVNSLLVGGGVAANSRLSESLRLNIKKNKLNIHTFIPPAEYCTDNAAMIAAAGYYNDQKVMWHNVTANPELYY